MTQSIIGAGWSYPARIDATGSFALVTRDREIAEAIKIILLTSPGERPMRPEFGCRIHEFVYGPVTSATAGLLAHEVRAALDRWEPRIDVTDVMVGFDGTIDGIMYVDIHYVVRGVNDPRNLVFPFYVIPDEPTAAPLLEASAGGA